MGSLTNCHSFLCVCAYMHTHVSYSATELQMNLWRGLIYQGPLSAQRYLDILSLFVIIFYFICLTTPVGVGIDLWDRTHWFHYSGLHSGRFHTSTQCVGAHSPHLTSTPHCSQPCALLLAPLLPWTAAPLFTNICTSVILCVCVSHKICKQEKTDICFSVILICLIWLFPATSIFRETT